MVGGDFRMYVEFVKLLHGVARRSHGGTRSWAKKMIALYYPHISANENSKSTEKLKLQKKMR